MHRKPPGAVCGDIIMYVMARVQPREDYICFFIKRAYYLLAHLYIRVLAALPSEELLRAPAAEVKVD